MSGAIQKGRKLTKMSSRAKNLISCKVVKHDIRIRIAAVSKVSTCV